jgi:hypothetical protein
VDDGDTWVDDNLRWWKVFHKFYSWNIPGDSVTKADGSFSGQFRACDNVDTNLQLAEAPCGTAITKDCMPGPIEEAHPPPPIKHIAVLNAYIDGGQVVDGYEYLGTYHPYTSDDTVFVVSSGPYGIPKGTCEEFKNNLGTHAVTTGSHSVLSTVQGKHFPPSGPAG